MDDVVEISRSELSILKKTAEVANAVFNDPKHGMAIKEAIKEKFPTATIPEVDAARASRTAQEEARKVADEAVKQVSDKISAFEKTWNERDESAKKAKEEAEFSNEVESTKKKYNLTAEGMEKVFQRMKERNNPDVEAAAAWVTDHESKSPPIAGNNYSPQSMDLYGSNSGDKEWAELNRNPLAYGDRVLNEMASDFANGNFGKYKEFGGTL